MAETRTTANMFDNRIAEESYAPVVNSKTDPVSTDVYEPGTFWINRSNASVPKTYIALTTDLAFTSTTWKETKALNF